MFSQFTLNISLISRWVETLKPILIFWDPRIELEHNPLPNSTKKKRAFDSIEWILLMVGEENTSYRDFCLIRPILVKSNQNCRAATFASIQASESYYSSLLMNRVFQRDFYHQLRIFYRSDKLSSWVNKTSQAVSLNDTDKDAKKNRRAEPESSLKAFVSFWVV